MFSLLSLLLTTTIVVAQQDKLESRYLRSNTHIALDPRSVQIKDDSDKGAPSRRRFIRYESSPWEKLWLENVNQWAKEKTICEQLNTPVQMSYMHDFLSLLCTAHYAAPYNNWCIIDDENRPLWYNTANRGTYDLHWENPVPANVPLATPMQPVVPGPGDEHIVSKMIFMDDHTGEEYAEYIEPLVSHLRFPLCKCTTIEPNNDRYHWYQITFKGYIIPPPPALRVNRKFYFDAGASTWDEGTKGSSLHYYYYLWLRSGHVFEKIFAYEFATPAEDFIKALPDFVKDRVEYQQCEVVSTPEQENGVAKPFLPAVIKRHATKDDYVLFKLDIDQPNTEHGTIEYILRDTDNFIDEISFEHHIGGNYLMKEWGISEKVNKITLRESYELFLSMRLKGIRAHSWI
jgi:hypothetical protein